MADRAIKMRVDYSFYHFNAAKHFCSCLRRIEHSTKRACNRKMIRHQAYASGAILSSVAFLESAINSFMPDADTNKFPMESFDHQIGRALSQLWPYVEKKNILDKFQITLAVACRPLFQSGVPPYQDAALLVHLRNALVHFKPEWNDELKDHLKIEKQLRGKFPVNPLAGETDILYFPKKCLGHGCAQWAVDTVEKFITEFYHRMNTEFLIQHLKPV